MSMQGEGAEPLSAARLSRGPGGPLDFVALRRRQKLILLTAMLLAALDGYDLLSMAVVGPAVSQDWHISKAVLGLLLSSGLVGMAVGSLGISAIADVLGRRNVVLACLAFMTVGSLLSAISPSVGTLAAARVVTGLGIGALIAMTTVISAEFSNARRRPLVIAGVATIGVPLGGVCGGLAASALLPTYGWPAVFFLGAAVGAVLLIVVALAIPETPAFVIARRRPDALAKVNHILQYLGHEPASSLPPPAVDRRSSYRALFSPAIRATTVRLAAVNFFMALSAYYLINWLPQLVVDAGFSAATASRASAISGLVGLAGGVAAGSIGSRFTPARLAAAGMAGMAIALAAFGLVPAILALLLIAAGLFGFFLSASTGMLFATVSESFPGLSRASGVGLVLGVGRLASALGPALAGWLFAHGLTRAEVSVSYAIPPLLAAVLIAGGQSRRRVPAMTDETSKARL